MLSLFLNSPKKGSLKDEGDEPSGPPEYDEHSVMQTPKYGDVMVTRTTRLGTTRAVSAADEATTVVGVVERGETSKTRQRHGARIDHSGTKAMLKRRTSKRLAEDRLFDATQVEYQKEWVLHILHF